MKRVIIVGSPRTSGRCSHLAEMLFEANIDERPGDELYLVPVSEIEIGPCIGCGACRQKSPVIFKDDEGAEVTEERYRCIFDDDMQTLYDLLDEADALTVVTPIYFSGAPAPMKCVLDRLQPYFWSYTADGPRLPKRPLDLHVVGEGGDPHGYDALVSEVRSATLLAGFAIERIFDWVGKISPEGEIIAEADEVLAAAAEREGAQQPAPAQRPQQTETPGEPAAKQRPKLSFSQEKPAVGKGAKGARAAAGKKSQGGKPSKSGAPERKQSGKKPAQGKPGGKGQGGRRG